MGPGLDRALRRKGILDRPACLAERPANFRNSSISIPTAPFRACPSVRRDLSLAPDADASVEDQQGWRARLWMTTRMLQQSAELLPDSVPTRCPLRSSAWACYCRKNAPLGVTLRAIDRTLTHDECNHQKRIASIARRIEARGLAKRCARLNSPTCPTSTASYPIGLIVLHPGQCSPTRSVGTRCDRSISAVPAILEPSANRLGSGSRSSRGAPDRRIAWCYP